MGNNGKLPQPCIDCLTCCVIGSLESSDDTKESIAKSKEDRAYKRFVKQCEINIKKDEKQAKQTKHTSRRKRVAKKKETA